MSFQPITAVAVLGSRHVTMSQAAAATGLIGRPVFEASSSAAKAALLRIAAVRDARVELLLPSTANVTLIEREAAGRWDVGGTEWFIDSDGVLFASADASAAPALKVRDDRVPLRQGGDRIDPPVVTAALRLAKIGPGELRADARAPAVIIEPGANGIVLTSGAGWEIRFGGPDQIEQKLAAALRFLRDRPDRPLEYVDVRSPDRVVYSPQ